jgi:hypothetical protein
MVGVEGEAVALLQIGLQAAEQVIRNLGLVAALLADQMVVMLTRSTVFKVQLALAYADRRHQPDALQPLERAVDRSDIEIWLLRQDRGVDLLGGQVLGARLDHLEHLKTLRRQAVALPAQKLGIIKMLQEYSPNL